MRGRVCGLVWGGFLFLLATAISFAQDDTFYLGKEQWYLLKIKASEAWEYSKGQGVVVAVLDSGVDYNHPELKGKVLIDKGYDFVNNDRDAMDDHGHGTSIAGILAAQTNNGVGLAGIGWDVKILPVKVMSAEMKGYDSNIAKGIRYAVEQGAEVISISISSPTKAKSIEEAVEYAWGKGAVIVSSAGNTGAEEVRYPAALKNVIGVGATDRSDQQPAWSTYGDHIDMTAPGRRLKTINEQDYSFKSGTSYATPLVAGTAALLAALPEKLTNREIVQILKKTADDLGSPGYDSVFGHGRLNAGAALREALKVKGAADKIIPVNAPVTLEEDPVHFSIKEVSAETVTFRVNIPVGVTYQIMGSNDSSVWRSVYYGNGNGLYETFTIKKPEGYTLFEMEY